MKRSLSWIWIGALLFGCGGCYLVWQHQTEPVATLVRATDEEEPQAWQDKDGPVDLTRKALERIPVGTVIGQTAPRGWTHLVLLGIPTLTPEDEKDAPKLATYYARMFKFTVLANVARGDGVTRPKFYLEKVARGFATTVDGEEKVVTSANTMGAKTGLFGRMILDENEKILDNEVRQIARTSTMLVFDAEAMMRRGDDHKQMIMRHALLVDPGTGQLHTLVWLLTPEYVAAEDVIQLLPPNMHEKRMLSVKRDRIRAGVLPTRDAFALRQVPPGTAIPYTAQLKLAATVKTFDKESTIQIERILRAAATQAAGN